MMRPQARRAANHTRSHCDESFKADVIRESLRDFAIFGGLGQAKSLPYKGISLESLVEFPKNSERSGPVVTLLETPTTTEGLM